jgi:hypothetical protein
MERKTVPRKSLGESSAGMEREEIMKQFKIIHASIQAVAMLVLAAITVPSGALESKAATDCGPVNGVEFLCGIVNIEQMVGIDGTRWAVGGSAAGGAATQAPLYFVNLDSKQAIALDPTTVKLAEDKQAYPGCPGPADFKTLQPLGIEYERVKGRNTLIVISHGGRLTIQVFEMTFKDPLPSLTWIGCVLPPDKHFWPDAVAALPDGGMLVTSLFDPTDPNVVAALTSGRPYGMLGEWHAQTGWKEAFPGTFAGPNGVILSKDHNTAFVANWSGKRVTRIDRTTGATSGVDLGMLVDNLAWSPDHSKIFAGGQTDSIEKGFECTNSQAINCSVNFAVYELDPRTLEKKLVVGPGVLGVMGGGTGALQDGDTLWITSYRSDRIARIKYPQ